MPFAARLIGHRGCAAHAPENTLAGLREAKARGLTWVEVDVVLLGDGTPVTFHDARLERTTDGRGALADLDWTAVSRLDAGSWFAPAFAGERVPRLDEALACVRELGLGLNLELKTHRGEGRALVEAVVPTLRAAALSGEKFIASSFDRDTLQAFHAAAPEYAVAALFGRVPPDWRARVEALDAVAVNADHRRVEYATVTAIKKSGRDVYLYTVNDPAAVAHMWAWGIDGVFTDDPEAFAS